MFAGNVFRHHVLSPWYQKQFSGADVKLIAPYLDLLHPGEDVYQGMVRQESVEVFLCGRVDVLEQAYVLVFTRLCRTENVIGDEKALSGHKMKGFGVS